jgi:hypothetical protein
VIAATIDRGPERAADFDPVQLLDWLTYAEIALAISASDMPTVRPYGVVEDPAGYAAEGLARLGLDGLKRQRAQDMRLVDLKYFGADRRSRRAASAAHHELWGGARRFDRAHSLAGRYWRSLT